MKLKEETIKQIKQLKEEGKTTKQIAAELKIPYSTTFYHFSEERKQKAKEYQQDYQKRNKPKRGDKYRDYQRDYQYKRYWRLKGIEK